MSRLWSIINLHEAGHDYRSAITPRTKPRHNIVALRLLTVVWNFVCYPDPSLSYDKGW